MSVDFSKVRAKEEKYSDLAARVSIDDLREATNESIDYLISLTRSLVDEQVVFTPDDPTADDPYAENEEDRYISWNFAHLIVHVTASSEEGAAFSSLLARGIPASERPRYETPWQEVTTRDQCLHRLEESRRIRLAYLDTWPDEPHLNVYRPLSPRFEERFGKMNATAAFLFGLSHELGHYDQIKEVIRQATTAIPAV